jgi:hypothetical protein
VQQQCCGKMSSLSPRIIWQAGNSNVEMSCSQCALRESLLVYPNYDNRV